MSREELICYLSYPKHFVCHLLPRFQQSHPDELFCMFLSTAFWQKLTLPSLNFHFYIQDLETLNFWLLNSTLRTKGLEFVH